MKNAAEKAVRIAQNKSARPPVHTFGEETETALEEIQTRIGAEIPAEQKRFYAAKLFERDDKITEQMSKCAGRREHYP